MTFIELHTGPWRASTCLLGLSGPHDAPVGLASLTWRHNGSLRTGDDLDRPQGQMFIEADALPARQQIAEPEAFPLRTVTTRTAGEAYVFIGEMFGRKGEIETLTPSSTPSLPATAISRSTAPRWSLTPTCSLVRVSARSVWRTVPSISPTCWCWVVFPSNTNRGDLAHI